MTRTFVIPLLAAALLGAPAAYSSERDPFDDGPSVGIPLQFASTDGGTFRPRALTMLTASGVLSAALPATSDDVRSEERIDFSDSPLVGGLFQRRLAPSDARKGDMIGDVRRIGDALVIDAANWPDGLQGLPVVLSTWTPSRGEISYRLGRLSYGAAVEPVGGGHVIGFAALVDGQLVIASRAEGAPGLGELFGQ